MQRGGNSKRGLPGFLGASFLAPILTMAASGDHHGALLLVLFFACLAVGRVVPQLVPRSFFSKIPAKTPKGKGKTKPKNVPEAQEVLTVGGMGSSGEEDGRED